MRNFIFLIFTLLVISGCEKSKHSDEDPSAKSAIDVRYIVDSLVYGDYGADIYYKLAITGGTQPYNIQWNTPSDNSGMGPFHKRLTSKFKFFVQVLDAENQQDTISYYYDYRDKMAGKYACIHHAYTYGGIQYSDTTYADTIMITKVGVDQIYILSTNLVIDSTWHGGGLYVGPHHGMGVDFVPARDSVYILTMDGGLGGGYNHNYKGIKITEK